MLNDELDQTLEFYRGKEFVLEKDPFDDGVYLLVNQSKEDSNGRMVIRCVEENLTDLRTLLEDSGF